MGQIALVSSKSLYYIAVCGLIAAGLFFFFYHRESVATQLNAWKLLPRQERLTELYFTDHEALPAIFAPNHPQALAFTIHNLEHQTTNYRYTIAAHTADNRQQVLDSGTAVLAHDKFQNIAKSVTVPALDRRIEIRVTLKYDGIVLGRDAPSPETQTIHYWVNIAGGSAKERG